ncbi:MAG: hypothetical protein MO847_04765 [Candidatus Protistobacter heckmanni]|nr:hypothetical protein [Candidatus Protistobacter heckmanni]
MDQQDDRPPGCMKCAHFYVTYEIKFPYGCKAMGFKSTRMPQEEVIASSNERCHSFEWKVKVVKGR